VTPQRLRFFHLFIFSVNNSIARGCRPTADKPYLIEISLYPGYFKNLSKIERILYNPAFSIAPQSRPFKRGENFAACNDETVSNTTWSVGELERGLIRVTNCGITLKIVVILDVREPNNLRIGGAL
jgi:hypothetical protein